MIKISQNEEQSKAKKIKKNKKKPKNFEKKLKNGGNQLGGGGMNESGKTFDKMEVAFGFFYLKFSIWETSEKKEENVARTHWYSGHVRLKLHQKIALRHSAVHLDTRELQSTVQLYRIQNLQRNQSVSAS